MCNKEILSLLFLFTPLKTVDYIFQFECLVVVPNPIRYSIALFPFKCSFNNPCKCPASRSIDYLFSIATPDVYEKYSTTTVNRLCFVV